MKNKSLEEFYNLVNSDQPAPGGGAVVSYITSLGMGLANMAMMISKKRKSFLNYDLTTQTNIVSSIDKISQLGTSLLEEIQKDIDSFNNFMATLKMPKETEEEKKIQEEALKQASINNIMLPYHVLEICLEAYEEVKFISPFVVKSIISDLAIGIIYLEAGINASIINLKINLPYISDETIISKVNNLIAKANDLIKNDLVILKMNVLSKIEGGN